MIREKTAKIFIAFLACVLFVFVSEIVYLQTQSDHDLHVKQNFVKISQLPDLALANEAHFVRHRSLGDVFSIFANSPELLEYFPSTFVYKYPSAPNTSRLERE